jgi:hypothetical protein
LRDIASSFLEICGVRLRKQLESDEAMLATKPRKVTTAKPSKSIDKEKPRKEKAEA